MASRILLTGGLGYIGSHTCLELIRNGYEPIILDDLSNSKKSVLRRLGKITGKKPNSSKHPSQIERPWRGFSGMKTLMLLFILLP